MSIRFTTKAPRGMAALTVAAVLALGAAGCGSGGGDDKKPQASATATSGNKSEPSAQQGTNAPMAELKGQNGLVLKINSATRDTGGFVTVSGEIKNDGAKATRVPIETRGDETEVIRHGGSLGGAALVDSASKKRYYVLRDTDGRPLTTTNIPRIEPGASVPVFMQFPAPPTSTTEVSFQLPTFASATISISG
ncbi:hypothetical protein ABZ023_01680 [Streptomyces sp. NPDC006367]|uniref:hypothetical protein n=1 Tax=unclassified Streptomyces TaxID=2593676 RepID=UPI0033B0E19F